MSPEAQAVINAACVTVDLDRMAWIARKQSEAAMASVDVREYATAEAKALGARSAALSAAVALDVAVDAYRASLKGQP
jgi:hypothetical protein